MANTLKYLKGKYENILLKSIEQIELSLSYYNSLYDMFDLHWCICANKEQLKVNWSDFCRRKMYLLKMNWMSLILMSTVYVVILIVKELPNQGDTMNAGWCINQHLLLSFSSCKYVRVQCKRARHKFSITSIELWPSRWTNCSWLEWGQHPQNKEARNRHLIVGRPK